MSQEIVAARTLADDQIPTDVENAIKAANSNGDLFSVAGVRAYGGQVLKAGVITLQPNAKLILNDYSYPWVAIVTNQLQFVDTKSNATIEFSIDWHPALYPTPPTPGKPGKGRKGQVTENGGPGALGAPGGLGHGGDNAPVTPKLYLIVGGVSDKQSQPVPAALTLSVIASGYSGGHGANGGAGGPGGDGGDGGNGEMGNIFQGCKHSASDGGPGGKGGTGGAGGLGGAASAGSDIVLVGPQSAWVALSYAAFETAGGQGGQGGYAGPSGPSGSGGARGSHPGTCSGGNSGPTPQTPPTPHNQNSPGTDGKVGIISKITDNNIGRFF